MDSASSFRLTHISDLHFSSGSDQSKDHHTHSIKHLQGLQQSITATDDMDILVVSGDISNKGDSQSLIMANGWLFKSIPIGGGEHTGLGLEERRLGIVPGNHDAWNAGSDHGSLLDRRQRSIENYNFAFPQHAMPESGCNFAWIEKGGAGLYIAFVDSCFLGDTDDGSESPFGVLRYDALAKGKLTVRQTEKLLEWHDSGMHGNLVPPGRDEAIAKETFAKSLKILVMHHYLFEPPEKKSDYFMRIQHRDIVFQNIALSDFDVLLCGHKHVPSFGVHDYGDHFDKRAVERHMLNYFRRLIGLESLPIQFVNESGQYVGKSIGRLVQIIAAAFKRKRSSSGEGPAVDHDELADQVFRMLLAGLEKPEELRRNVERLVRDLGEAGASALEPDELKRIQKRISTALSMADRKRLRAVADEVTKIAQRLKSRAFVQIMSGSSAKMPSHREQGRSYHTYDISQMDGHWQLVCQRFDWNGSTFRANSAPRQHAFPSKL